MTKKIMILKKGEFVKFKICKRKIKLPVIIYADFENILVPENNEKQNPEQSYTNKYQEHVASSYAHKLVCVHDRFSKPFKTYLVGNAVYISSLMVGLKEWNLVMK